MTNMGGIRRAMSTKASLFQWLVLVGMALNNFPRLGSRRALAITTASVTYIYIYNSRLWGCGVLRCLWGGLCTSEVASAMYSYAMYSYA